MYSSKLSNEAVLNQANDDDPSSCSICYELYSIENPVMIYSTCGHIICSRCVKNYGTNRCQIDGRTDGTYQNSTNLTQSAKQMATNKTTKNSIKFSVVDMKGSTYQLNMHPQQTINDMMQEMSSKRNVHIAAVSHKNKIYKSKQNGNTTLKQADVDEKSRMVSVAEFNGGRP